MKVAGCLQVHCVEGKGGYFLTTCAIGRAPLTRHTMKPCKPAQKWYEYIIKLDKFLLDIKYK